MVCTASTSNLKREDQKSFCQYFQIPQNSRFKTITNTGKFIFHLSNDNLLPTLQILRLKNAYHSPPLPTNGTDFYHDCFPFDKIGQSDNMQSFSFPQTPACPSATFLSRFFTQANHHRGSIAKEYPINVIFFPMFTQAALCACPFVFERFIC